MQFLAWFLGAPFGRVPSGHWFQPFTKVVSAVALSSTLASYAAWQSA